MSRYTHIHFLFALFFLGLWLQQLTAQDCESISRPQYISGTVSGNGQIITNREIKVADGKVFFSGNSSRFSLKSGRYISLKADPSINSSRPRFLVQPRENGYFTMSIDTFVCPRVILEASTTSGFAPLTVSFRGSDSYDPDGNIRSFRWIFGNGESTSPSPTHTFTLPGTYKVTLIIKDNDGITNKADVTINVEGLAEEDALAEMKVYGVTSGGAGAVVDLVQRESFWRLYKPNGSLVQIPLTGTSNTNRYKIERILRETGTWEVEARMSFKYLVITNNGEVEYSTIQTSDRRSFRVYQGRKYAISVRLQTVPIIGGYRPEIDGPTILSSSRSDEQNRMAPTKTFDNSIAHFKIYPNPASNQVFISYQLATKGSAKLSLHNLLGQKVFSMDTSTHQTGMIQNIPIDIQQLADGLYMVVLSVDGKSKSKKLWIKH